MIMTIFSLCACQTAPMNNASENRDYVSVAETYSCEEISNEIERMEKIIDSSSPSETERLFTNTAISAARTGINVSGALGSAGAFVGIGIGFFQNLYSINGKKRQQQMKDIAYEQQNVMLDAYYYKPCDA